VSAEMATDILKKLILKQKRDGIYLTVPSSLKGRVKFEEVRRAILKRGVVNANFEIIKEVFERAEGVPVRIGDYFEKFNKAKNRYIEVRISEDELTAFLSVRFPRDEDGIEITFFDINFKILEAGITVPIDEEVIEQILKEKKNVVNIPIAHGKLPIPGEDAKLVYKIDTNISRRPLILEDGRVDYHRINLIKCVEKDQHLVERIPATPGKPGYNVFGKTLKATPGKDIPLPRGLNTYVSKDKNNLYAKIGGHIFLGHNLLNVENVYVVRGDVDFSTGDIEYSGDVVVIRDVKTGFKVETTGNVRISGNVDGATVISREGEITVWGGIFGKHKAKLIAKKRIQAGFVQDAFLQTDGDVEITKYILNSTIHTKGRILIPKGHIIGGRLVSGGEIVARTIGSPSSLRTEVQIGSRLDSKSLLQLLVISRELEVLKKRGESLRNRLQFLTMLKQRQIKLTKEKQKQYEKCFEQYQQVLARCQELERQKSELVGDDTDMVLDTPKIEVKHLVFPGVVITMNQYEQEIKARHNRVLFRLAENGIRCEKIF